MEKEYAGIISAKLSKSSSKDPKHFWQAIKDLNPSFTKGGGKGGVRADPSKVFL